jgi:hypothetical protein
LIFRHPPTTGSYSKTLFCWIDVLGFSDLVEASNDPNEILSILSSLDFSASADFPVEMERRIISDTIIVWSRDPAALYPMMNIAALAQANLIKRGYLLKGVIGYGDHFHDKVRVIDTDTKATSFADDIVVSKVLVQCVKEEKNLKKPVVKILPNATSLIGRNQTAWPEFQQLWTIEDDALVVSRYFGSSELNVFKGITGKRPGDTFDETALIVANIEPAIKHLTEMKPHIEAGLRLPSPQKKYWDYLAAAFNKYIDDAAVVHNGRPEVTKRINELKF